MARELDPIERRLRAQIGGLSLWAQDPEGAARRLDAARRKAEDRFTSPQERKLYFARLALRRHQAARERRERAMAEGQAAATRQEERAARNEQP